MFFLKSEKNEKYVFSNTDVDHKSDDMSRWCAFVVDLLYNLLYNKSTTNPQQIEVMEFAIKVRVTSESYHAKNGLHTQGRIARTGRTSSARKLTYMTNILVANDSVHRQMMNRK